MIGSAQILLGDCREVMATMEAESVDAVVCDPPYGLEFMGKEWDKFRIDDPGTNRNRGENAGGQGKVVGDGSASKFGAVAYGGGKRSSTSRCTGCGKRDQFRNAHECAPAARWVQEILDPYAAPPTSVAFQEWCRLWAREAYRVLKPGGHLLAFGGTRMFHRLTCAIEDAGLEIRDCLSWLYGSGFPKSLDVSKAIDKAAGAEREVVGVAGKSKLGGGTIATTGMTGGEYYNSAPATPAARAWSGSGTALKPVWEPIILARKPLGSTVAACVLKHGTGAINVDGCRIGTEETLGRAKGGWLKGGYVGGVTPQWNSIGTTKEGGRWPANVILSHTPECADGTCAPSCPVRILDEQSGESRSVPHEGAQLSGAGTHEGWKRAAHEKDYPKWSPHSDSGGASRFFLNVKPDAEGSRFFYSGKASRADRDGSSHPTTKPTELMRWLCKLITPSGGLILDPFCGGGSTGVAAVAEGFRFVGIEKESEYVDIARRRIANVAPLFTTEEE